MKTVGEGVHHKVAVDTTKNRLYFWFLGDLMKDTDLKGLLDHIAQACKLLSPGFTLLSDFRQVRMVALPDVVRQVQESLSELGVSKVAVLWSIEGFSKIILDRGAQSVSPDYAEKRRSFASEEEAVAWLDG